MSLSLGNILRDRVAICNGGFFGGLALGSLGRLWKAGCDACAGSTHETSVGDLEKGCWQGTKNALGIRHCICRGWLLLRTDAGKLGWRNPRSQEVNTATNVLRDSKSCGQSIDSSSRVGQDGEFGDS